MFIFSMVKDNGFWVNILEQNEKTVLTIIAQVFRDCYFVDYVDRKHWSVTLDTRDNDKWAFGQSLFGRFSLLKNGSVTAFSTKECEQLSEIIKLNNVKDKLYRKRCLLIETLDEVVKSNATLNCEKDNW